MFANNASRSNRPSVDDIIAQNTSPLAVPGRRSFGWLNLGLLLLVLALIGTLVKVYFSYQEVKIAKDNLEKNARLSTSDPAGLSDEDLLAYLGQRVLLPDGRPAISTIKDVDNLKQHDQFFTKAANDDKYILYNHEAVIYRPSIDRIINFAPTGDSSLATGESATSTEPMAISKEKLTVEVRNGTEVAGLAAKWKSRLADAGQYDVAKIGNASQDTYTQTYLINLTGKDVSALEQIVGVSASVTMPAGEATSSQDVLLIVSK